jgi:hypothetical protein
MLAAIQFVLLCLPDSCLETEIIIHTTINRTWTPEKKDI